MSYCVNCGVQLATSEKSCPLCGTPVINPRDPNPKNTYHPHAQRVEQIIQNADKRYAVIISAIFLAIPVAVSLFVDWMANSSLTWSMLVLCSAVFVFVVVLLPLLFKHPSPVACVLTDTLALIWLLKAVHDFTGGDWFFSLGIPLGAAAGGAVLIYAALNPLKRFGLLGNISAVFIISSALLIAIEIIIDLATANEIFLSWSLIAASPCFMLGLAAIMLRRRQNLREKLRRKMFF